MIKKHTDDRGDFVIYDAHACDQVNVVTNPKPYTFRGLHYQTDPSQAKTVKVIQGKVLDFLYNLDTHEVQMYLLDKDSKPLYVAENYAHGYLTLEPHTIFTYAVEGDYNPDTEHSIIWKDVDTIYNVVMSHVRTEGLLHISEKDKQGK